MRPYLIATILLFVSEASSFACEPADHSVNFEDGFATFSEQIRQTAYLQGRVAAAINANAYGRNLDISRYRDDTVEYLNCSIKTYNVLFQKLEAIPDGEMSLGDKNSLTDMLSLAQEQIQQAKQYLEDDQFEPPAVILCQTAQPQGYENLYRTAAEWALISDVYYGRDDQDASTAAITCAHSLEDKAKSDPELGLLDGIGFESYLKLRRHKYLIDTNIVIFYPRVSTTASDAPATAAGNGTIADGAGDQGADENVYSSPSVADSPSAVGNSEPDAASMQRSLRDYLKKNTNLYGSIAAGVKAVDMTQDMVPHSAEFGWGASTTIAEADAMALRFCEETGASGCYIARRLSGFGTCGYVTRGFAVPLTANAAVAFGYGTGDDESEAIQQCESAFYGNNNSCAENVDDYCVPTRSEMGLE
jgi:hypothetical protein